MKKSIYWLIIPVIVIGACVMLRCTINNIESTASLTAQHDEYPPSMLININTATVNELCYLPSIKKAQAIKIVDYRKTHGPFQNITDLLLVKGIGQGTYDSIAQYITVGG